ncbi:DUF5071 domain-containing protein [Paenibacillus sp. LPE1-1-1.1]|uniref:DUF5071 domain-containing protein n=1 Tax=Paenibacillus sp. LPE1-1-1.1 TaxID=3135230 RepID=UPI003412991C
MDHTEIIPRTKFDNERANQLENAKKENILLVLPQLLEWLQDINWPIAQDIGDVLVDFEDHLIPHIRAVLNSDDGGWKFSFINPQSHSLVQSSQPISVRCGFT